MMQGQIGVRSQHGKGSTFWFTARLEKQVSAVKVPERSFRDLYNFQVLVVDDNSANRDILRHQILAWKMQANSAASGAEALKILRAAAAECKPYDLALLDVQMAEMDGLTLARAIKADPTITGTRLILLTGFSKRISPPQPRAEGIMECCFKPVRQSRLFECLANALLGPSTTPRTFAKALIAPLTGLSPEAKTESLAKVDDFAIDAVQSSLSEGMLQSSKELGSTIGVSSSHGLTEAFERDANCQLGTTRWACAGGDTRRLREEAEEFDGASCTIDAQVTGGICRYEIRSGVCGASMKTTLVNAGSYYQARETFEGMYPAATLASIICQGPSHERNFLPVQLVSEFTPIPSRYLFVSHMGSNDSNSKWFDLALKAFQERYPSVKAEYLSTNECSTQKYVQLIEHAISTKPDGLVVAITDAAALDGVLRKAISQGIPVIAFNTPDLREPAARIPYLTFVGTNYHSDGKRAGEHALAHAKSGEIPLAKQVLCANPAPAHGGLLARCKGMTEAMNVAGIKTETLVTDSDPALASYILRAYLMRNPDVNYIYAVTGDSGPAVWDVCNKMGLHPDLGDEAHNVTIIGVDDNPVSLSGVKAGHLLSTVSQEFWLQGYVPLQWLYWYREYGYTPESDTLTGPVIIDKTNVDQWIALVQGVIGADNFRSQIPW
jgi:simple sugar transport system substrate-binding protein